MQHRFTAPIEDAGSGGAFVTVPFDVEKTFGEKRPKVKATFDGVPYRGTLVRMGGPRHFLPILKAIREQIGKGLGDPVEVTVEADAEPREVPVPEDLADALADAPDARAFFDGLAYTHRREYVRWIEEAKREETRARRVAQAVAMLREGKRER
jgi:hypothetical protein